MTILTGKIYCPLCEAEMARREVQIKEKRATVYFCRLCNIGIYDFDPAFNKWRDADKDIPCAVCGFERVKWFIRFMDGFFKSVCPRCKTILKKDGDVKIGKGGALIIPEDMEQDPIEEPVEIKIPWTHLVKKLGKDKTDAIKNKLRRKDP